MDPNLHRSQRFDRRFPGERLTSDRKIAAALFARERELRPPRPVAGESFKVRVRTAKRPGRLADPAPNAPLLKRIVLNPYVESVTRPARVSYPPGGLQAREARQALRPAILVYREAMGEIIVGNPMKTIVHRPVLRGARLSVEQWLGERGEG